MLNSSSMHSTCEASTPKLWHSFVFTKVGPRLRVGFVVTSLLWSSRCRLNSVRISLLLWCVAANNQSSTWNTSDTRFVVWVHRQVSSTVGTKPHFLEDLLQMVVPSSRCASQALKTFLQFPDHCSFARIQCFRLPLRWRFCVHHVTVLHMCVEEGDFHVSCEHCVAFLSEV